MFRGVTLKQIEAFYWIAELESFTAAASRLNSTQPALSNRMREFEDTIGTKLFMTDVRKPRPTAKGREILVLCAQFLELSQKLANVAGSAQPMGGLIRVGASDNVALTWLPKFMADLGESYPQIDVDLNVDLSHSLLARLYDRRLDIAFLSGPISDLELSCRPLGYMRNAWMCAPSLLRRIGAKELTAQQMATMPIFTSLRGSRLHQMVIQWFDTFGVRPTHVHGCTGVSTMIRMTLEGVGLSILPLDLMRDQIKQKKLKVLLPDEKFPPILFEVVYHSSNVDSMIQIIADMAMQAARTSGMLHPTPEAANKK